MGADSSNLTNQILCYYLFHKKLELFFNNHYNPFINDKKEIKLESYYIINKDILKLWKEYCNYSLHKAYLDKIDFYSISIEGCVGKIREVIQKLNVELNKANIIEEFDNGANTECNWYCKSRLQKESFDNVIDERTYEYFKNIFGKKLVSSIKGIITNEKLIIFYEKTFQIKFLYHGQIINQGIENNNSLIQLTADFSQISNGIYDKYSTQDAYNGFKNLIKSNINYTFKLFDNKNINYSKQETISFCKDIGNGNIINYNFILRNDNLNHGNMEQTYKNNLPNNNPQNNNVYIIPKNNNALNKSQNYNNQQININNNYTEEINELKRQLNEERDKNQKLINENQLLQEKINKLNTEINQLQELKSKFENDLSLKTNEMQKLLSQNNKDYYDISSMKPNDKIITVNFVSMGNNDIGHYSLVCKYRDLFVKLEERLYNDYPKFKEFETCFEVNGKRIKRFLSLEQNKIKNNDVINLFVNEEV